MSGIELATAYVSIVPTARGIGSDIARTLTAETEGPASTAGDKAGQSFGEGFGNKAKIGAAAAGAAVGAAAVAGAAIAIEREAIGDKLAAQLNLSAEDSAKAGDIAGSLYADAYGESLGEVSNAVGAVIASLTEDGAIGSAGGDVEQLTAKVLDLSSAFGVDASQAVSSVGILMRSGLVSDANEGLDLVTAALQQMPVAMRDELFAATDEYGTFFATLGISADETFGALVNASRDGMYGIDKTGDAIKELTIRSTDMSALSVSAYEAMGLNAGDMAAKILAGGDTARGGFDQIVNGLLGITDPTAQANAAIALFGTPIEDLNVSEIPSFLTSLSDMGAGLGETEGAAARMGDTLNDNAASKIEGAKRSVEGFLASIVEGDGPIATFATGVAGVGSAIQPVAPLLGGVTVLLKDQVGSLASSTGKFLANKAAMAGHTAATVASKGASLAVAGAQKAWAGAQWALNAAMTANPIVLVVAAIVALVAAAVLAYQKVDWFRAAVDAAWQGIQVAISFAWENVIKPIWDVIVWYVENVLIRYVMLLWTVYSTAFKLIAAAVLWAWDNVIKPVWDAIYGFIVNYLIPYYQMLWDIAVAVWNGIAAAVQWAWDNVIKPVWDAIYGFIVNYLIPYYQMLWTVVQAVWAGVTSAISGAWDTISGIFTSIAGGIVTVRDTIWGAVEAVVGFFTGLPGRVLAAASGIWDFLGDQFRNVINGIVSLWNNLAIPSFTIGGWSTPFGDLPSWTTPRIDFPDLPRLHSGGFVPGRPGSDVLTVLQAGELVLPVSDVNPAGSPAGASGGRPLVVQLVLDGKVVSEVAHAGVRVVERAHS